MGDGQVRSQEVYLGQVAKSCRKLPGGDSDSDILERKSTLPKRGIMHLRGGGVSDRIAEDAKARRWLQTAEYLAAACQIGGSVNLQDLSLRVHRLRER